MLLLLLCGGCSWWCCCCCIPMSCRRVGSKHAWVGSTGEASENECHQPIGGGRNGLPNHRQMISALVGHQIGGTRWTNPTQLLVVAYTAWVLGHQGFSHPIHCGNFRLTEHCNEIQQIHKFFDCSIRVVVCVICCK